MQYDAFRLLAKLRRWLCSQREPGNGYNIRQETETNNSFYACTAKKIMKHSIGVTNACIVEKNNKQLVFNYSKLTYLSHFPFLEWWSENF
jgi:hypothetical protein